MSSGDPAPHGTSANADGLAALAAARLLPAPRVSPPLDPQFRPAVLARRALAAAVEATRAGRTVTLAVEQPGGSVSTRTVRVVPDEHPLAAAGHAICERTAKTLLWARGGQRIWVDGPEGVVAALRRRVADTACGRFDAELIGVGVYGAPVEVVAAPAREFPSDRSSSIALGGHLDGCRVGFDLGASDRKAAAVVDGEVVYSEEVPWDPVREADPAWHLDQIGASLLSAASHLPRVDAIGGSAAGAYVANEVRVASLFRAVPREQFDRRVRGIFRELQASWHGIPFEVANDGEVTALAGSMASGRGALLGIAMGSSEAAGYVTRGLRLTPWLDELAFVPIDFRPDAPRDEWSGDIGCGVQYLSQQAVGRLLPAAGIELDESATLPERLVRLQTLMEQGDPRATRVYETVGVYLGYALLEYADWYDIDQVLLLGRVTSGAGGAVINQWARRVLRTEAPELAARLAFGEVSERDKRHGQAVAAASLPIRSPSLSTPAPHPEAR